MVKSIVDIFSNSNNPFKNDWEFNVSRGNVKGCSSVGKFGVNRIVSTTTDPEDIWEYGGKYVFSDVITLDPFLGDDNINRVSSSNALDTQEIIVYGLDKNGEEVEQYITLQGQTPVELSTKLWRCYRIVNNGTGNIQGEIDEDINGIVYVYTDDATVTNGIPNESTSVRAVMSSANQTLMAIYTVPKGKTGYLVKGEVGLDYSSTPPSPDASAIFRYLSRRVGKVFNTKFEGALQSSGTSIFQDTRSFLDPIPELTDVVIEITSVSENNVGAFSAFDILLIDNEE